MATDIGGVLLLFLFLAFTAALLELCEKIVGVLGEKRER